MKGEVVGVNTYSEQGSIKREDIAKGLGNKTCAADGPQSDVPVQIIHSVSYARSSFTAARYVRAIIATGEVKRADLGLKADFVDPERVHLPRQGVEVEEVAPGSAAERAGLKSGFIVYSVEWSNGFKWETPDVGALEDALAMIGPNMTVKFYEYSLTAAGARAALERRPVAESEITWLYSNVTAPAPFTVGAWKLDVGPLLRFDPEGWLF
jgi:S1-C subfamily serine protease